MTRISGVSHSYTGEQERCFFMPSCYAVRANKALIYAALRARKWERQGLIPFPSKLRFYCVTNPTKRGDEAMAVFRMEKNKGYTVMSNHHLPNKELSLKAKGLISCSMQSFSKPRRKSVVPSAAHFLYQNQTASNTARLLPVWAWLFLIQSALTPGGFYYKIPYPHSSAYC